MKKILTLAIKSYQYSSRYLFQNTSSIFLVQAQCRFHPTCSEYALEAIDKHGAAKGSLLALKRILKCNPWFKPGLIIIHD